MANSHQERERSRFFKEGQGRPARVFRESGHLAHIFNPGRAMLLCSAYLSPQALMQAKCPRSLIKNRRREAASPYHSKLGTGHSSTMKRCPA